MRSEQKSAKLKKYATSTYFFDSKVQLSEFNKPFLMISNPRKLDGRI
jgi:hypothetical protein